MRLYYWMTCPFACKTLAVIEELGLKNTIECVLLHPWEKTTQLSQLNPLKQIPILELEEGFSIVDSPVIIEYLDSIHQGTRLIPPGGMERWRALKLQAIADGIMESAILRVLEEQARHELHRSDPWIQRQNVKLIQSLDYLEKEVSTFQHQINVGTLSIAIALSYLNLRFSHENWAEKRQTLDTWFKKISERPSIQESHPRERHALPDPYMMEHLG